VNKQEAETAVRALAFLAAWIDATGMGDPAESRRAQRVMIEIQDGVHRLKTHETTTLAIHRGPEDLRRPPADGETGQAPAGIQP
jgi:hypothetical protein